MWFIKNASNQILDWLYRHAPSHKNSGADEILLDELGEPTSAVAFNAQNLTGTGTITASSGIWWHEYNISPSGISQGATGAVFTPADANTVGGWQLDNAPAAEYLYFWSHVEADWDAASDVVVEVCWEINVGDGSENDTVDLQLVCRFRGEHESAMKTQTLEVAHSVTTDTAQYMQHKTELAIDYNDGSNPVQAGDIFGMVLNLETDTSEIDNIIVNYVEFKYHTAKPAPEV